MVFAFTPPAVLELGNAGGFDLDCRIAAISVTTSSRGAQINSFGMAAQSPVLAKVRPNGIDDAPQISH